MAKYTIRSGVSLHPEDSVLQHLTDMVRAGGVINPETEFLVVEPSGGGRNVDVGIGRGYIKKTGNAYPVRSNLTETVSIDANASGNPRIDSVVIYLDLSAVPAPGTSQGEDVLVYRAVPGTPGVSPSAPDESEIEAEIGGSNPYEVLANVTVASGATGISNANIAQATRRVFMKSRTPLFTETYSATVQPDYLNGSQQEISLTGNIVINEPTNMEIGDVLIIDFIQDATGGRTATWTFTGKTVKEDGGAVELSGTADAVDTVGIRKISADTYYIYPVGGEIA